MILNSQNSLPCSYRTQSTSFELILSLQLWDYKVELCRTLNDSRAVMTPQVSGTTHWLKSDSTCRWNFNISDPQDTIRPQLDQVCRQTPQRRDLHVIKVKPRPLYVWRTLCLFAQSPDSLLVTQKSCSANTCYLSWSTYVLQQYILNLAPLVLSALLGKHCKIMNVAMGNLKLMQC